MALDIANIGKTTKKALTGAEDHVDLGANWTAAWIIADVDCHITVDGSAADQSSFFLKAGRDVAIAVYPPPAAGIPANQQGGSVHFVKDAAAAVGNIYITEVC